jgi:hypothetical protein
LHWLIDSDCTVGGSTAATDAPVVLGSSIAAPPPPPDGDNGVTGGGVDGTGGAGTSREAEANAIAAAAAGGGDIRNLVAVTFGAGHLGIRLRRSHASQSAQARGGQGGQTSTNSGTAGGAGGTGGSNGHSRSPMCGYHVAIRDFPNAADGTDSPVKRINLRSAPHRRMKQSMLLVAVNGMEAEGIPYEQVSRSSRSSSSSSSSRGVVVVSNH